MNWDLKTIVLLLVQSAALSAAEHADANQSGVTFSLNDVIARSDEMRKLYACCGPLSLARSLSVLGQEVDFDTLHAQFRTRTEKGVRLYEMVKLTQKYRSDARAVHIKNASLADLPLPAILFTEEGRHCVVLEEYRPDEGDVVIWDPRRLARVRVAAKKLRDAWGHEAILFPGRKASIWLNVAVIGLAGVNLLLVYFLLRKPDPPGEAVPPASVHNLHVTVR